MSGGWCNSLGHHFVAPLWPFGKWRCLHCGLTEREALIERKERLRVELEALRARQAESAKRTAAAIARADAAVDASRAAGGRSG